EHTGDRGHEGRSSGSILIRRFRQVVWPLSRPKRRQRCRPADHPETSDPEPDMSHAPPLHRVVADVTARIAERSAATRAAYLDRMAAAYAEGPVRRGLACSNLAHGFAAMDGVDKEALRAARAPGVAIVSSYNDMLSAHQPLNEYPAWIKDAVREAGGVAQFAGGVPAMCDGVTQGRTGMELSLFSREVIAMSTAIALSHDMFDAALLLGVCDKIVPGLLIGALAFGHLPASLVPAGPMNSGLPNKEKARVRQLYAEGRATREDLLDAEAASYHSAGTCTFYGTANSNQMVVEVMGLHLPGASFVQPHSALRRALTEEAGLLHEDVHTVAGFGLHRYRQEPILCDGQLIWRDVPTRSLDEEVLRPAWRPFAADGGLRMVSGNLGRAVIKVSAVAPEHRVVQAPARVFTAQEQFTAAFEAGELSSDVVVVIRQQGPQANGMPELHGLTPALGVLMDRGHRVALLTDGRMSGASGKIPAAIQVTPEAAAGGPIARIQA